LLVVSWLLVAFTPGLLMLATFGLERIEAGLGKDTVSATDVAEFLEQARPVDVRTLARQGMPQALDDLHRRIANAAPYLPRREEQVTDELVAVAINAGLNRAHLSVQQLAHSRTNRQFAPRQRANRV
jgi:hypothetical protein